MPVTTVNGAAGTIQVKLGGGVVRNVTGIAAGTSYTFKVQDGPDVNGNFKTLFGATAIPVVANQQWIDPVAPIPFINGLAFVVTGTPGEFYVQWD
jgi:hypothetical protein